MIRIKPWKTLTSKNILNNPRLSVSEDTVLLPNGMTSLYVRHAPAETHSVAILAINDDNQLLIQREYSYPPNKIMWQLPGGSIHKGEDILTAANRELAEESGYKAKKQKQLGYYFVHNRLSDQKQFVILATDLYDCELASDPDEFIESLWKTELQIRELIKEGHIDNINLLAALNIWFNK